MCFSLGTLSDYVPGARLYLRFIIPLLKKISLTLGETNIAMENGAIEDVFPFEDGDIPFLCQFTRG